MSWLWRCFVGTCIAASSLVAAAPPVSAGAWPKAPGESEAILTYASKVYDDKPEDELDLYVEHGVREGWTAVAGVRGWSRSGDSRTFAQVGLRRQFKLNGDIVAASETRLISGRDWNECGGWGVESRILAGAPVKLGAGYGFIDLEAAARSFSDGCAELRIEGSAGIIPEKGWGILAQANSEKLLGPEAPGSPTWRVQTQVAAVLGLGAQTKLQIGARIGFEDGKMREQAAVFGVWRKF